MIYAVWNYIRINKKKKRVNYQYFVSNIFYFQFHSRMNRFGLKYKCVNLAFLWGIFCIAWRIVTHQMLLPQWQRKCQINFKINYFSVTKFHKLLLKPATHGLLFLFIKKIIYTQTKRCETCWKHWFRSTFLVWGILHLWRTRTCYL